MSKRLILILALAFVVAFAFAAYAETQNVKVSGDITVMGVARDNFTLAKPKEHFIGKGDVAGAVGAEPLIDFYERDLLSIVRLRVDADLTDNVTATIRLLSERNWNGESEVAGRNNANIGLNARNAVAANRTLGAPNVRADEEKVDLDLAYVTLKEFLYSPLTMTIGRQELHFGNDWIVGDPDTNGLALGSSLAEGDLSARKAFDAIRATLNYSPLTVDIIYAKVTEGVATFNDDTTLTGLNATYELNKNTTVEGFLFSKMKQSQRAPVVNVDSGIATSFDPNTAGNTLNRDKTDQVHTVGVRVVNKTVKNLTIDGQAAFQFGFYNPKFDPNAYWVANADKAEGAQRRAWGLEIIGTYDLKDVKVPKINLAKYSPSISAMYAYLSGADRDRTQSKTYHGWDPMYENQTAGHILNAIMGFSNINLGALSAKAKPTDDITAKLDYVAAWFAKRYPEGTWANLSGVSTGAMFLMNKTPFVGQEIDLTLTYDYTEDVQFSLLGGIFLPGGAINTFQNENDMHPNRANAREVIGSMKVTF